MTPDNNFAYYDKIVRGTEREDGLVIVQFMKGMVGETFSLLNYYKEIPVSYDAKLVSVENEMAEFAIHEYQAKVISIEKKTLIRAHAKSTVPEDMVGEAFYVSSSRKRLILTNFHYAKIRSDLRRFVRVRLENRHADADLYLESDIIPAMVRDISLGGVALLVNSVEGVSPGADVNLILKLSAQDDQNMREIGVAATIVRAIGHKPPYTLILEFHSEKHSQQSLAYYINQRQVEIIRELKDLAA